jgi:signal transduction histidine kinase
LHQQQKSETAEDLALTIRDTGTGIDQKYVKDIFKPFFTTKERGVGLGLAICQKIIREHNGRISVQSIASQGTTVVIQLKRSG